MPRQYTKRQPEFPQPSAENSDESVVVAAPAPPSPNPAVLALQEDVVALVRSRTQARAHLTQAQGALISAQTAFQVAQGELNGIEQEVQYLHSQIAQLEGRTAPLPPVPFVVPQQGNTFPGVSSAPTTIDDMINRGHASRAAI